MRLHCFRCGRTEFVPHRERSIAEIMATRRALDDLAGADAPAMPHDAVPVPDGPPEAWRWVLRGGLTPEAATAEYGFRWHERSRRVLIPVPGGLLGRSVHGERPKYRLLTATPGAIYWPARRQGALVVVVEDVLSAIAVHRAGWPACAVLGTAISPEQAADIASGRSCVIGWFDGDRAGDQAHSRLRRRLGLHDVRVHRTTTS